jgi:hypothetical protein
MSLLNRDSITYITPGILRNRREKGTANTVYRTQGFGTRPAGRPRNTSEFDGAVVSVPNASSPGFLGGPLLIHPGAPYPQSHSRPPAHELFSIFQRSAHLYWRRFCDRRGPAVHQYGDSEVQLAQGIHRARGASGAGDVAPQRGNANAHTESISSESLVTNVTEIL